MFLAVAILTSFMFAPGLALAFNPPGLNGHHVVDQSGRLSADDVRYLDHQLEVENKQTTNEIAVLIISKLNGEDIKDIGYTTFNTWHLGKSGKDNGILFTIVTDDRKARIDTGKGTGGALTDIQCNDIIKTKVRPAFRAGNLRKAIDDGTNAAANLLRKDQGIALAPVAATPVGATPVPAQTEPVSETTASSVTPVPVPAVTNQSDSGSTAFLVIMGLIFGFGFLVLFLSRRKKESEFDYQSTPAVPPYASPIYTQPSYSQPSYSSAQIPQPSYSDERTTIPLPTPLPTPRVPNRSYPSRQRQVPTPVEDEDDDDVSEAGVIAGAIGAAASILSSDDDDDDDDSSSSDTSDTDSGWDGGGGGECGGGGSDDDL